MFTCKPWKYLVPVILLCLLTVLMPACSGQNQPAYSALKPAGESAGWATEPPAGVNVDVWTELRRALAASLETFGTARNVQNVPQNAANRVDDLAVAENPEGGVILTWTYRNRGDYDFNGEVNVADLTPIGVNFMANDASADWFNEGVADGDDNGEVNVADIVPIGANFRNTVHGYVIETSETPDVPTSWVEVGQVPLSEGKFTSGLPRKQIHIEAQIVELSIEDTISVRPFQSVDDIMQLGIRSYDDGTVINDGQLWNQVGGNALHTSSLDVQITALANRNRSLIMAVPRVMATSYAEDPAGNYFIGGAGGVVTKYSGLDELIWETEVDWPVDWLSYMVIQSLPALIAFHGDGLSRINPETGIIEQTDNVGAVAVPPVVVNPLGPDGRLTFGTSAGFVRSYDLNMGLTVDWETSVDGPVRSVVDVDDAYAFYAWRSALETEFLYMLYDNGTDLQEVEAVDGILGPLRRGWEGTFWANLEGTKLQSYNSNGSKGSAIVPNDGEIKDFDTFEDKIAVAVRTGMGGHKGWVWNVTLEEITGEHVHDKPVDNVRIDAGGVVTYSSGDINGFSLEMGLNFTKTTEFKDAGVRLNILPKIVLTDGIKMEIRNRDTGELEFNSDMVDQGLRPQLVANRDILVNSYGAWHSGTAFDPGNTIILDSLIRDGGEVKTVAPALSKIPLLGSLFSSKAATAYKEELLVTITPRIIYSASSTRQPSDLGNSGLAMVNVDTGEVEWDTTFDEPDISAPAQVPGMYYLVSNDPGANSGTLHAIDENTGAIEWSAPLGAAGITVPAVSDAGWVYVADEDGHVYAVNSTGGEEWVEQYPDITTGLVISGEGNIHFATADGMVYALDVATGALDWSVDAGGPVDGSTPSIAAGGLLRLGTLSGNLVEIDPNVATPSATALYTGRSAIVTQPVSGSGGNTVFADSDGWVKCIDAGGNLVWTFDTGIPQRIELSLAPNGNVYVGTVWGEVIELGP